MQFWSMLHQQLLLHALKAFQPPVASIPGCILRAVIALCCFHDSYFVACVCSMVQCVFKLPGPCDHVHLLSIGNHHWQGCQEEEEVPVVGPLLDTVSDISVCQHAGSSSVRLDCIPLPQVSIRPVVLLHDLIAGPISELLHQEAWWQVKVHSQKEDELVS